MKSKYFALSIGLLALPLVISAQQLVKSIDQTDSSQITQEIANLANSDRAANNLPALSYNLKLAAAAEMKLDDMLANNYFAHNSPLGLTPWYFISKTGYDYQAAGENLAENIPDPKALELAWMESPEHRANILNNKFTDIGIAEKEISSGGQPRTLTVELFASPETESSLAAK